MLPSPAASAPARVVLRRQKCGKMRVCNTKDIAESPVLRRHAELLDSLLNKITHSAKVVLLGKTFVFSFRNWSNMLLNDINDVDMSLASSDEVFKYLYEIQKLQTFSDEDAKSKLEFWKMSHIDTLA